MKKINKKRFIPAILILVAIIVIVILLVFKLNSGKKNNEIPNEDNPNPVINSSDEENSVNSSNDEEGANAYNPNVIPQKDTVTVENYVDVTGNTLNEESAANLKTQITNAFKSMPSDKLGLSANLNNVRFIFNQGTTTIDNNVCLIFSVYNQEGEYMKNIGMYAMSEDTNTLYRFNSDNLTYELIK